MKTEFNPWLLLRAHSARNHYLMVNATGRRIVAALERLGRTQTWLAEQMGVSDAAVHKWIASGQIARDRLIDLASTLHITIDELLTGQVSPDARIGRVVSALPAKDQELVLDFVKYRWERASARQQASEARARDYVSLVDELRNAVLGDSDAVKRKPE